MNMNCVPIHTKESQIEPGNDAPKRKGSVLQSLIAFITIVGCIGYMENANDSHLRSTRTLSGGSFQKYYNVYEDEDENVITSILPDEHYPAGDGTVISVLVASDENEQLKATLRSLAFLQGNEDPEHPEPVLVFHEGHLSSEQMKEIAQFTDRPIGFPIVDFSYLPRSSNPEQEDHQDSWDYLFMKFWVTLIWKHPAVQRFDTVMRIDSDSCFKNVNDYLPHFQNDFLYYHSPFVGLTQGSNIDGLFDFVKTWIKQNKPSQEADNELLFDYAEASWNLKKTLPAFQTTFELVKISFMKQKDVVKFSEALIGASSNQSQNVIWDDSVLRFLTLSAFAPDDRLTTEAIAGYVHKNKKGCSIEEVEKSLTAHNLFSEDVSRLN